MYAHVNIWQLNEPGRSTDDTAAREIGTQLSQQPGATRSHRIYESRLSGHVSADLIQAQCKDGRGS